MSFFSTAASVRAHRGKEGGKQPPDEWVRMLLCKTVSLFCLHLAVGMLQGEGTLVKHLERLAHVSESLCLRSFDGQWSAVQESAGECWHLLMLRWLQMQLLGISMGINLPRWLQWQTALGTTLPTHIGIKYMTM